MITDFYSALREFLKWMMEGWTGSSEGAMHRAWKRTPPEKRAPPLRYSIGQRKV